MCFSDFRDYAETSAQMNPWWAVDLGRPYELTNLVVHNRKGCCRMCLPIIRFEIKNNSFCLKL